MNRLFSTSGPPARLEWLAADLRRAGRPGRPVPAAPPAGQPAPRRAPRRSSPASSPRCSGPAGAGPAPSSRRRRRSQRGWLEFRSLCRLPGPNHRADHPRRCRNGTVWIGCDRRHGVLPSSSRSARAAKTFQQLARSIRGRVIQGRASPAPSARKGRMQSLAFTGRAYHATRKLTSPGWPIGHPSAGSGRRGSRPRRRGCGSPGWVGAGPAARSCRPPRSGRWPRSCRCG